MFQEQTVIVIKAPEETKLEVSAAEEDSMQVYLKATKSPIMIGTCEVGSDDTVTSDPEDKSGVFSTLEESLIRTAELFTVEDEEHTSSGESESEAPTTLEHVETRKVSTGVRKSSGWKTLKEEDDKMGPRCQSVYCIWSGARKCGEIRERDREAVFKRFRQKMNNTQRKKYVVSLVDVAPGQNQGPILLRFRMEQRYHLIVKGQRMRVCKPMFLSTLGLSHRYVAGCMAGKQQEKTENREAPSTERRGPSLCSLFSLSLSCSLLKLVQVLVLVQLQDAALMLSEEEDTRDSHTDLTTTEENTTAEAFPKEDKEAFCTQELVCR
ncbi:uncharacterized protein LOC121882399 isoform X1 [Scomber scombrus]|uniref:Uncharacterized protein LOC121882399 isoform X1 n=1 Tax=Scomber scombrus TaxID=13677 RepID=A0AAV1PDT2_SCOSC